jgi:hypothetical protein
MGGADHDPEEKAATEARLDRRQRHRAREAAAGWTRCIVRCHVDDVAKIKAYASALIEERMRRKAGPDKG